MRNSLHWVWDHFNWGIAVASMEGGGSCGVEEGLRGKRRRRKGGLVVVWFSFFGGGGVMVVGFDLLVTLEGNESLVFH